MSETPFEPEDIMCVVALGEDIGQRADAVIQNHTDLSRSAIQKLILSGNITVDGKTIKKNYSVCEGDRFLLELPEPEMSEVLPENIPLDIIYEDEDIIVVNKPQGMVVHPAPGHATGTLVSALLYHCGDSLSGIGGVLRPGIVHRIDRDTGGLICVAKNDGAHIKLSSQLEDHSMARVYSTVLVGHLKEESGRVDAPIGRHPKDRKKMAVVKDGKRAVTNYRVIEEYTGYTLAEMRLETGRTHQIRVHMAYLGHPVLGDNVYGGVTQLEKKHPALFKGQFLYATELSLTHPRTGERMTFKAPLPDNFNEILRLLKASE